MHMILFLFSQMYFGIGMFCLFWHLAKHTVEDLLLSLPKFRRFSYATLKQAKFQFFTQLFFFFLMTQQY